MYDKIPGLLYSTGALFTIVSWVFILFSRNIHPKNKKILILRLSIIWMLFFASSVLMLVSDLFFDACAGFLDPDVLDFYNQRFIRLAPAATCVMNFCVSTYCSMNLVKEYTRIK